MFDDRASVGEVPHVPPGDKESLSPPDWSGVGGSEGK